MRHVPAALGAIGLAAALAVPAAAAPTPTGSAPAPQEPSANTPQSDDGQEQDPKVDTVKQKVDADTSAVIDATGKGDENSVVVFGATWSGDQTPQLEYRSKVSNGLKWTMWQPMKADQDGPDADAEESNTSGTAPVNAAYNEKIEVRTTGAPVTVSVTTTEITDADRTMVGGVNDEGTLSSPDLSDPAATKPASLTTPPAEEQGPIAGGAIKAQNAASIGGFKYFSRKQWGAKASRCSVSTADKNRATIIHHTEGSNTYSKEQVPGILRGIQAFHQGSRHWCDIGYNMLVDKYGNIYEGRPKLDKAAIGAHAASVNRGTFGISVLGSYSKKAPQAAIDSVARIVAWQSSKWKWDVDSKVTLTSAGGETRKYPKGAKMTIQRVSGHRDVGNTDCPGDGLYSQLPDIRKKAQQFQKGGAPAQQEAKSAIQKFYDANKAKTGKPTGKEHGGLPGGGSYQAFEKGAVHHSPKTGTHFTRFGSGIQKNWAAQGFERGKLGYPTSEENCTIKDGGCYQAFQNGSVHWSPNIGARKLMYSSAIRKEWEKQNFERGKLGYPTTEEFTWGKYKRVNFEGGYITWEKNQGVKVHLK